MRMAWDCEWVWKDVTGAKYKIPDVGEKIANQNERDNGKVSHTVDWNSSKWKFLGATALVGWVIKFKEANPAKPYSVNHFRASHQVTDEGMTGTRNTSL